MSYDIMSNDIMPNDIMQKNNANAIMTIGKCQITSF